VCYNCHKKGHVVKFCPHSNGARHIGQTNSMSPEKVRHCYHYQSTNHLARFCTKANYLGDGDGQTAQATISARFNDACMSTAARAFSRDVVTGARVDVPTGVCAFSRDETTDAQVCVDSNRRSTASQVNGHLANSRKSIQPSSTLSKGVHTVLNSRHCITLMLMSKADNGRG